MAAPAPRDLPTAVAQGDLVSVEKFLKDPNTDINKKSKDGMTPLSIAAFWGYSEIVHKLVKNGADVNAANSGTHWTPLHCAAFQGHGPVIMKLINFAKPDLTLKDHRGRTAADFASALDSIWAFFAAAGLKRTPKADLIRMDIVQKISFEDPNVDNSTEMAHFSRPGSAYGMRPQMPMRYSDPAMEAAAVTGDVLASMPEEPDYYYQAQQNGSGHVWAN